MATSGPQAQETLDSNTTIEANCNSTATSQQDTTHPAEAIIPSAPQLEDVLAVAPSEWCFGTKNIKYDGQAHPNINDEDRRNASNIESRSGISLEVNSIAYSSEKIAVRNLYQHKCLGGCCPSRWSKFVAPIEEETDLQRENATHPILHFHTYDEKHWITSYFVIQNSVMKRILVRAFEGYQDLDMELVNWTFKPPYMPIVHRWDRLKELQAQITDLPSKHATDILMEFLRPILASPVSSLLQTTRTKKISFETIWQIFPPGELVITKLFGIDSIRRVIKYDQREVHGGKQWIISTEHVDWDGEGCGYATDATTIQEFEGFCRVTSLSIYPLSFKDAAEETRAKMIERGRKFELLRGYHFRQCNGKKILLPIDEDPKERQVSGRVIIDAFAYYQSRNYMKPELRRLSEDEKRDSGTGDDISDEEHTRSPTDTGSVAGISEPTTVTIGGPVSRREDFRSITDEDCLLATPWVTGFDLKTKEWALFCVDDLKEIDWNDAAFENLVLPGGEKELAWEFVENKNMMNNSCSDFIPDKGRGIIILMFGPPGVGKTYTAEAVAEKAQVPLFSMSAGLLGTEPEEVEDSLEEALELCRLWNAIMLLDEADVFLGVRTNDGLARNELVSIFLTKLEYYQGILFLTTNRITSIDYAFQSRVDLFLPYSNLSAQARKQVWENFINYTGQKRFSVSQEDLEELSKHSLNGREIKNLIKSAQLLSFKDGGKISVEKLHMLAKKRTEALRLFTDSK